MIKFSPNATARIHPVTGEALDANPATTPSAVDRRCHAERLRVALDYAEGRRRDIPGDANFHHLMRESLKDEISRLAVAFALLDAKSGGPRETWG